MDDDALSDVGSTHGFYEGQRKPSSTLNEPELILRAKGPGEDDGTYHPPRTQNDQTEERKGPTTRQDSRSIMTYADLPHVGPGGSYFDMVPAVDFLSHERDFLYKEFAKV